MKSNDERKPVEGRPPDAKSAERSKRFRIERLEERIAPRRGGNGTKNNCYTGDWAYTGSVSGDCVGVF